MAVAPMVAGAHGPVMQIDQKKVPVYHGEKDKDTISIIAWCQRTEFMKDALGGTDEATYANAIAALFGCAQRTADDWTILYLDEHRKTWSYLKKKMLSHYSNMIDSRSFIDAMFSIRPRVDNHCNLDTFNSDCIQAFAVVRETQHNLPPDGQYTAEQCHQNYFKVQQNILDQICMAFMVHLLPPDIWSEVMKKKPASMAQSTEFALET